MMQALELFTTLKSDGIKLKVLHGELLFAPANRVNDKLRMMLRTHKDELIALLAANDHYPKSVVTTVIQETVRQPEPHSEVTKELVTNEVTKKTMVDRVLVDKMVDSKIR